MPKQAKKKTGGKKAVPKKNKAAKAAAAPNIVASVAARARGVALAPAAAAAPAANKKKAAATRNKPATNVNKATGKKATEDNAKILAEAQALAKATAKAAKVLDKAKKELEAAQLKEAKKLSEMEEKQASESDDDSSSSASSDAAQSPKTAKKQRSNNAGGTTAVKPAGLRENAIEIEEHQEKQTESAKVEATYAATAAKVGILTVVDGLSNVKYVAAPKGSPVQFLVHALENVVGPDQPVNRVVELLSTAIMRHQPFEEIATLAARRAAKVIAAWVYAPAILGGYGTHEHKKEQFLKLCHCLKNGLDYNRIIAGNRELQTGVYVLFATGFCLLMLGKTSDGDNGAGLPSMCYANIQHRTGSEAEFDQAFLTLGVSFHAFLHADVKTRARVFEYSNALTKHAKVGGKEAPKMEINPTQQTRNHFGLVMSVTNHVFHGGVHELQPLSYHILLVGLTNAKAQAPAQTAAAATADQPPKGPKKARDPTLDANDEINGVKCPGVLDFAKGLGDKCYAKAICEHLGTDYVGAIRGKILDGLRARKLLKDKLPPAKQSGQRRQRDQSK